MRNRPGPSGLDGELRLAVYQHIAESGVAPSPVDLARRFGIAPMEAEDSLRRLAETEGALVLLPGSPYVWMAEPFSAVPTSFTVESGSQRWWGNCIWDALAILALLGRDGTVSTSCPDCSEPMRVGVDGGVLEHDGAVAHFAVPAREWWRDIGFT